MEDISSAAGVLLDPDGVCAPGRKLLVTTEGVASMEVDSSTEAAATTKALGYCTAGAAREVESWLITLAIRLLWKENKMQEAFSLAQNGIAIVMNHLDVAATKLTSLSGISTSSLFPLLARLYRYRSWVGEHLGDAAQTTMLREDLVKAHNLACLRRDVDSQATLLNLMFRDLLLHSQSKS